MSSRTRRTFKTEQKAALFARIDALSAKLTRKDEVIAAVSEELVKKYNCWPSSRK